MGGSDMRADEDQFVVSVRRPRRGWKQAFHRMHEVGDDRPILDGLTTEFDEEEWEW